MKYFIAYTYTMGTGNVGTGNVVLETDREIQTEKHIQELSGVIRQREFEPGTNVAIVIINFIKL